MKSKIFSATTPDRGRRLAIGIDVSIYANPPYNSFSPLSYSKNFYIPVPGQIDTYSHSVEGIWQGLKLIGGQTDPDLFLHRPKKRRGIVEGHRYGNEVLGIFEARKMIYRPAYHFYVENHVDKKVKEDVLERGLGQGIAFFDVAENTNIEDISSPLAHSYFLAEYFYGYLGRRLEEVRTKIDEDYETSEFDKETLAEPIARALTHFRESFTSSERQLAIHFLIQSHEDVDRYRRRFYDELNARIS